MLPARPPPLSWGRGGCMAQFQWSGSADGVYKIFDDPVQRRAFVAFCRKEYSLENAVCLMCIGLYQREPSWEKARLMHRLFFDGNDSPHEVNVRQADCIVIYNSIYKTRTPYPQPQLFVAVTRTIVSNLGD